MTFFTTFKTLNKKSRNTVNRPFSSTVIWHDSIGYDFITLEPKILTIAKALSILFISINDKMLSFSSICTPCCRTKKIGNSDFFGVIQDVFRWHSGILVDIVFPTFGDLNTIV